MAHRVHRALIGSVAATLMVVFAPASAHAATPANVFTIDAKGASALLQQGGALAYSDSEITAEPFAGGVALSVVNPSDATDTWGISIAPPAGENLVVGTYQTSRFADATHAQLEIGHYSLGCNGLSGTLVIKDIQFDASQHVTTFAGTYATTCDSTGLATGEIRYNSTVSYNALTASSNDLNFGNANIGQAAPAKTVTYTSVGPASVTFGGAAVGGTNADTFRIATDTCSHQTLSTGESCAIGIIAEPFDLSYPATATLTMPDNSPAGQRFATLEVYGNNSPLGVFQSTYPTRVLDTRTTIGGHHSTIGAGGVVHVPVAQALGLASSGVSAVVINLTETSGTSSGYFTAYPSGTARPTGSSLNYRHGYTVANSVTVPVGSNGGIDVYNSVGKANVIVDIFGYYLTAAGSAFEYQEYHPLTSPNRVLDTRANKGKPLPSGYYIQVPIGFTQGKINTSGYVRDFVVNITAVSPQASGYLTAFDGGSGQLPSTSTLNFVKGQTVANLAIVPVSTCDKTNGCSVSVPQIGIANQSSKPVHILVDIIGFFDNGALGNGARFHPMAPNRIVDTRTGKGGIPALGAGKTDKVTPPATMLDPDTEALAMNLTAVSPTASTYLTVWPDGQSRPTVSNLNPPKGVTLANAAMVTIGADGGFNVFNQYGTVHLLVDVAGTFDWYPYPAPLAGTSAKPNTAGSTWAAQNGVAPTSVNALTMMAPQRIGTR